MIGIDTVQLAVPLEAGDLDAIVKVLDDFLVASGHDVATTVQSRARVIVGTCDRHFLWEDVKLATLLDAAKLVQRGRLVSRGALREACVALAVCNDTFSKGDSVFCLSCDLKKLRD